MTCIAACYKDNQLVMGGDSAGVDSSSWAQTIIAESKVFKKKNMLFGYTSSFRMGQIIQYCLNIPEHPENMDTMEYLVCRFIESYRITLKNNGFLNRNNGIDETGSFLLGYKNRIFNIQNQFQIIEDSSGIMAVGCAADQAIGAMEALFPLPNKTATEIVQEALSIAEYRNIGVSSPFNIITL